MVLSTSRWDLMTFLHPDRSHKYQQYHNYNRSLRHRLAYYINNVSHEQKNNSHNFVLFSNAILTVIFVSTRLDFRGPKLSDYVRHVPKIGAIQTEGECIFIITRCCDVNGNDKLTRFTTV